MKLVKLIGIFHKTLFITALLLFVGTGDNIYGQSESLLNRKVETVEIDALDFSAALPEIAKIFNVPIGFENSKKDVSGEQSIRLKKVTLKEVLDYVITRSNPEYTWEVVNDVINVYPKENRDSVLEELLKIRIEKFAVGDDVSNLNVRTQITDLPEIKSEMSKNSLKPLNLAFFSSETRKTSKFEISLENVSLRELLNNLIKKSHNNFWVVSRYGTQREFLIIDF